MADTTLSRGFARYHLTDDQPVVVETVDGPLDLGRGWLVVSEAEHRAFVGLLDSLRDIEAKARLAASIVESDGVRSGFVLIADRAVAALASVGGRP